MSPNPAPDTAAIHALAVEALTAPRVATAQVLDHILAQHEITSEKVNSWLAEDLAQLEPYELDLLLSPLFTPDFATRLLFEPCLGAGRLTPGEVDDLVERLDSDGLKFTLLHEGASVPTVVPRVAIDRFIRLLHLDAPLPDEARAEIAELPAELPAEVHCFFRDRAWQRSSSRKLIPDLLDAALRAGPDVTDYMRFITDFIRTHRPTTREECVVFLGNLAEAYEADLKKYETGVRSFFNVELQTAHAGKWKPREEVLDEHHEMIEKARALSSLLS